MTAIDTDVWLCIVVWNELDDLHQVVDFHSDLNFLKQKLEHGYVGDIWNAGFHAHVELE